MKIKNVIAFLIALWLVMPVAAQLPQFSSSEFDGWVYSNPNVELNQSNILNKRIYLYVTSTGLPLTLTSPAFSCYAGEVIDMNVTWITDQWKDSGFDVHKVALTAALLNDDGVTVDSVTYNPTSVSKTNYVDLSITVPKGLSKAKLRFAAWKGDVNNSGAVFRIVMTSKLKGDVNLDGEVSISDVNAIVDALLGANVADDVLDRADVNDDGEVTILDINTVIDIIIG